MEDLAAMQRVCRPLGEDVARRASSDGGSAAVYGLDSTPAKGTQPAEALNLAKRHTRLQRKPLPNTNGWKCILFSARG